MTTKLIDSISAQATRTLRELIMARHDAIDALYPDVHSSARLRAISDLHHLCHEMGLDVNQVMGFGRKTVAERTARAYAPFQDRPLAAHGWISYRAKSPYGWIMIGAANDAGALKEARRSNETVQESDLQIWNGREYAPLAICHQDGATSATSATRTPVMCGR